MGEDNNVTQPQPQLQISLMLKGTQGMMKCGFKDKNKGVNYYWSYHGRPQASFIHFDAAEGSFFIDKAEPKDSGRYECWENGKSKTGEEISRRMRHRLIIYVLPDIMFKAEDLYLVGRCDQSRDDHTVMVYHDFLCKGETSTPCPYDVSHNCQKVKVIEDSVERPREAVLFQVMIQPTGFIPPPCDPQCVRLNEAMHLTRLQQQFNVKMSKSQEPIFSADYQKVPDYSKQSVVEKCPLGFIPYSASVCAPCEPGEFWKENKCLPCPNNTYQDVGAGINNCKSCPSGSVTIGNGSNHLDQCKPENGTPEVQHVQANSSVILLLIVIIAAVLIILAVIMRKCSSSSQGKVLGLRKGTKNKDKNQENNTGPSFLSGLSAYFEARKAVESARNADKARRPSRKSSYKPVYTGRNTFVPPTVVEMDEDDDDDSDDEDSFSPPSQNFTDDSSLCECPSCILVEKKRKQHR